MLKIFTTAVFCACSLAAADDAEGARIRQLIDQSGFVVHGRVIGSTVAWNRDHTQIWTHHEIEVLEPLKGVAPQRFQISEPGGTLDGITMTVSHSEIYQQNEEVVMFVKRRSGDRQDAGYSAAKFGYDTPDLQSFRKRVSALAVEKSKGGSK